MISPFTRTTMAQQPLKKRLSNPPSTMKRDMKKVKRTNSTGKSTPSKKRLKTESNSATQNFDTSGKTSNVITKPVLKQLSALNAHAAAFSPLGLIAAAAQEVSDGEWALENRMQQPQQFQVMHPQQMVQFQQFQPHLAPAKSVINAYHPRAAPQHEETRPETSARYTTVEEKALVHAKLRLQISSNMGQKSSGNDSLLTQYYEYYLQLLDPTGFMGYSKREESALVRKFKSIKSKKPMLVEYLDTRIEKGFWLQLKDMVITKPGNVRAPMHLASRNRSPETVV